MSEPSFFEQVGTNKRERLRADTVAFGEQATEPAVAALGAGASRWCSSEDKFWGAAQTHETLPPGLYRCGNSPQIGPFLDRMLNQTDSILELPDSATETALEEIREFSTLRAEFEKRGFLFKRGILLWGPPGSGKTCTLQLLMRIVVEEMRGIAVMVDHPEVAAVCLQLVRKIEPHRQLIAVMEDMDALVENYGENKFLSLLDGEAQVDNIICVATTNYPERLDKRFVDRPSRFDTIKYVGMPSAAARRAYFEAKEPGLTDLTEFVAKTDGFSIAHMRELLILTQCFKRPLQQALDQLRGMQRKKPASDQAPDRAAFGFVEAA